MTVFILNGGRALSQEPNKIMLLPIRTFRVDLECTEGECGWTTSFLSVLLGLRGRPNGCVLRRGRRPPLPLFVFSPRRLCALHHAVYNFPILDTNRQQVSTQATLLAHYALPHSALTHLLYLPDRVAQRQRLRRHRRGGSFQPRGEADILPLQKV